MVTEYFNKYLKYKNKYLELKKQLGGVLPDPIPINYIAAGIIEYYIDSTGAKWLRLGKDRHKQAWSYFGGTRDSCDKGEPRVTALREAEEEGVHIDYSKAYIDGPVIELALNRNHPQPPVLGIQRDQNQRENYVYFIKLTNITQAELHADAIQVPWGVIQGDEIEAVKWFKLASPNPITTTPGGSDPLGRAGPNPHLINGERIFRPIGAVIRDTHTRLV
jgi:hypothetical protein